MTWPTPAAINYGTPLSSTQLNATASVPGTFSYSPALGAVLPPGDQVLSVIFTPTDTTDYQTVSETVPITVNGSGVKHRSSTDRLHVGEDEVLLDDSVRIVDRALAAGVDAQLDIWEGMVHGFPSSIGQLSAAKHALKRIGAFLSERFTPVRGMD